MVPPVDWIENSALKWVDLIESAGEPPFLLCSAKATLGHVFDLGIGDGTGEDGVAAADVVGPHDATKLSIIALAGKRDGANAFDDEVSIGQHVHHDDGCATAQSLAGGDKTAALGGGAGRNISLGQFTLFCAEPTRNWAEEELLHLVSNAGCLFTAALLTAGEAGALIDEYGNDVTNTCSPGIGVEVAGPSVRPEGLSGKDPRNNTEDEQEQKVWLFHSIKRVLGLSCRR